MSSHKNKVIRERLEKIYGKGCMFQKAYIAERIEAMGRNKDIQRVYPGTQIHIKEDKEVREYDDLASYKA